MTQRYFATTSPGFEKLLAGEIAGFGAKKIDELDGGVEFDATNKTFYRACYESRLANRILIRVDEFRSRDFPELYNKTRRYQWERLLGAGNRVYVKGVAHDTRLIHTDRIQGSVGEAIREHFSEDLGVEPPEIVDDRENAQYVLARIVGDRCQLSLDASGELMHRRGWRVHAVTAPIRETTAATILEELEWAGDEPLFDPMCGSGTFPIQAARIAADRPPGEYREFAFHRWQNFRPELWQEVVDEAAAGIQTPEGPVAFGSDIDEQAVEAARQNAEAADVSSLVSVEHSAVSDVEPPTEQTGLMICNPPYGRRLDDAARGDEPWRELLDVFARRFKGWKLAVLLPGEITPGHDALSFEKRLRFRNGGILVRLWDVNHA
ncbi:MAG: THUMP domain-containing class I SAM-dependent RNA methyltransferase [Myxococcota bacterium]